MDEARYRAAQAVASELQAGMRDALRDGYIFVLPTTPGSAPPTATAASQSSQDGSASAAAVFRERCIQFSAVAALSGVPQVVLPLPLPGGMPLSVSLLALHKRDLALLQAAAKLGPMLAEEAATLAAQRQQERRSSRRGGGEAPRWQPQAAAAAEPSAVGSSGSQARGKGNSSGGKRGSKPGSSSGAADPAQAVAEARKEDGNAAFRAGRYEEAVRHYSAAAQLYPRCAVYYANRAMAYLKLGSYGAAEADCDEALKLELSAKALLRRASARLAQVGLVRRVVLPAGLWAVGGQQTRPGASGQHGIRVPVPLPQQLLVCSTPTPKPPPHTQHHHHRAMPRAPRPTSVKCLHWSHKTSRQGRSCEASRRSRGWQGVARWGSWQRRGPGPEALRGRAGAAWRQRLCIAQQRPVVSETPGELE